MAQIALQLYSLLDSLLHDEDSTIHSIHSIGYAFVEAVGRGGPDPLKFKARCRENKLTIIACHQPDPFEAPLEEYLETAQLLGVKDLVTMFPPDRATQETNYVAFASKCNSLARALAEHNIRLHYHLYHYDLAPRFSHISGLDIVLRHTDATLLFLQPDTFYAHAAGVSPESLISKCKERCRLLHIKDSTSSHEYTELGKGVIDWTRVCAAANACTHLQYFILEQDMSHNPLHSAAENLAFWQKQIAPSLQ